MRSKARRSYNTYRGRHDVCQRMKLANRYQILKELGRGHTSIVYEAMDEVTKQVVALKTFDPLINQDATHVERFKREAEILSKMNHPHIIKIFNSYLSPESGMGEGDTKFLVIEKFDGENLKSLIAKSGILSWSSIEKITNQILDTLICCHEKGVVHRDLKPQNILVDQKLEIRLLDFGISRMTTMDDLTKTGTILGTPEYLAPECFSSSHVDLRADVYSLGCVLYEMISSQSPFHSASLHQIFSRKIKGEIKDLRELRPDTPSVWLNLVQKCLHVDPDYRYQNVREIQADIQSKKQINVIKKTEAPVCLNCKTHFLLGANFCYNCGKMSMETLSPGEASLIIKSFDNAEVMKKVLFRLCPQINKVDLEKKLQKLPVLLVKNVDSKAAMVLKNEFLAYPVEIQVTNKLPVEFQLPQRYFLLAIFAFLPIFVFEVSLLVKIFIVLLCEFGLYVFYLKKTIPLVSSFKGKVKPNSVFDLSHMLGKLPEVKDQKLRAILGQILLNQVKMNETLVGTHWEMTKELVGFTEKILDLSISRNYVFERLQSEDLVGLKKKMESLAVQIKNEKEMMKLEGLIHEKGKTTSLYYDYRRLREENQDFYNFLLNYLSEMDLQKKSIQSWTQNLEYFGAPSNRKAG